MHNILTSLLICLAFHSLSVHAIKCYQCASKVGTKSNNKTLELCSLFDWSSKFVVDCPLSTFCMKRNYTMVLPNSQRVTITERGCAQQSLTYQILTGGKWKTVNDVDPNIYQEGCTTEDSGQSLDKGETLYCFCSGYLCNGASSNVLDFCFILLLPLLALNIFQRL